MNDWKEVSWIEAANAYAAGTHEAQDSFFTNGVWCDTRSFSSDRIKYRIREKVRTITVTIREPRSVGHHVGNFIALEYETSEIRDEQTDVIRAAIEGANDGR